MTTGGLFSPPRASVCVSLEPSGLQDVVDVLPDIVKAATGVPLEFRLDVTPRDGKDLAPETVESVTELVKDISPDPRLKR